MEQNPDLKLVKNSLKNLNEFGKIVDKYEESINRYIRRISNFPEEELKEILQEIFIKVWINLNEFDQNLKFSSWIYRIAHNEIISSYRKKVARGDDKKISIDENLFQIKDENSDLIKEINNKLTAQIIREHLNKMEQKYKEVLILKYFEDKSYEEISQILKIPSSTVGTLINRGKKIFKNSFNINQI